ncbi:alpha/beta hydrolase [Xylanibacillus composti]|uniref:Exported protein n=1 Tax=Xylanibacillus composti TaxID=1572762 RepID=A0A8J4M0E3_9BACL|nr:alpha/beta hydrolase [Xylanibacillus composti]MDT9725660.1 alpha/beta hydrolase [Xylanibacillus composti]GIQ67755.1 exported protein [Xylanibacillus composti]
MLWLWIVLATAAASAVIGYYFSNLIIHIRTIPYEQTLQKEAEAGRVDPDNFERMPKQKVWIDSPFGYSLHAYWIPSACQDSKKVMIFVHGVTHSLIGSVKYLPIFQKRGYHAFIYDHRRHGRSGGTTTTFGYMEKHDLKACVDWVQNQLGADAFIGIHGESMGAATALQHAAIDGRAAFYIADCPYSDLTDQLAHRLKEDYRLPKLPLLHLANAFTRLRAKFWFSDVSPIRDIAHIHTPVLFVHGEEDRYVPTHMSLEMYEIKPGMKQLYLVPEAAHAQAITVDPAAYEATVAKFLDGVESMQEWATDHSRLNAAKQDGSKTGEKHDKNHFTTTVQPLQ